MLVAVIVITNVAYSQEFTTVKSVISGTIFLTSSGKTIHLLGVDAPKAGAATPENAFHHLEQILIGNIILVSDSLVSDAATGSLSRYVYLPDGRLVNLAMIADGFGTAARIRHSRLEEFLRAELGQKTTEPTAEGSNTTSVPRRIGQSALDGVIEGAENGIVEIVNRFFQGDKNSADTRKSDRSTTSSSAGTHSNKTESNTSMSAQCSATTKKGKQCSRRTTNSNGRCWQHQ